MSWRVVFGVLLPGLAACAAVPPPSAGPRMMACPHVPAPPVHAKATPLAPASGFTQILRPGHWDWADYQYNWVPAQWLTLLTNEHPLWQSGFWRQDEGACIWIKAHFIMPGDAKDGPRP
jgi:hypothetical protein